jgi:hypothetical protein
MSATAALYGIRAAAGLGQGIFGLSQMSEAKRREEALRAQGLPQMSTPQEYFDLYQNASRSRQFEEEKAATQSILAANLATLEAAGSRAVIGGGSAAQLNAQRGIASAASRDFNRQQQALGQLAGAQQRTEQLNYQARANQYARDLLTAQAGYQAGAETMIGGFSDAIGAGILAADSTKNKRVDASPDPNSGGYFDSFGNEVSVKPGSEKDFFSEDPTLGQQDSTPFGLRKKNLGFGVGVDTASSMDFGFGAPGFQPIDFNDDGYVAPFDPESSVPFSPVPFYRNQGPRAQGGSVTTPGKYTADHSLEYDVKTKDGKTIATVTGDETLVFNPQQRGFLKKVIGKLMSGKTIKLSKAEAKAANQTFKAFKK